MTGFSPNSRGRLLEVGLERGSLEITKEVARDSGWESSLETSWQDVRFGLCRLRKSPGFTAPNEAEAKRPKLKWLREY
jgi:hypothetical protein